MHVVCCLGSLLSLQYSPCGRDVSLLARWLGGRCRSEAACAASRSCPLDATHVNTYEYMALLYKSLRTAGHLVAVNAMLPAAYPVRGLLYCHSAVCCVLVCFFAPRSHPYDGGYCTTHTCGMLPDNTCFPAAAVLHVRLWILKEQA